MSFFDPLFDNPPALDGTLVTMEPLDGRHREGMWLALADPAVWRWVRIDGSASRELFDNWFDDALQAMEARLEFPFAAIERETGRVVGTSRFLSLRPADRGVEIGWSLITPEHWGTGANSEAKLLMTGYAFEVLGCARVEFKTDRLNDRARAALAAIPAEFEGIFRKHMLMAGGRWRDSAWYAVIEEEWPDVRVQLEARLARQLPRQGTR
ncbi:MAG: N-acetyltransferase [Gaiellales bacterium]|jgi:RimJ/RimL family protein N-acetyltransferase|nr:N-acetyltransferase [Gaiellales bacterium]